MVRSTAVQPKDRKELAPNWKLGPERRVSRRPKTEMTLRGDASPRPFVKWAGGKTQLLDQFELLYPPASQVQRYIEPFVGSGAVFFQVRELLQPKETILADGNEELINAYRVVQNDVADLIKALAKHKKGHSQDHYYRVRGQSPKRLDEVARAARLIYLNKTCFNGLYRVNSRGEFNVPMGRYKDPPILDERNLRAVSKALAGVKLWVSSFRKTAKHARAGDFIYFDPPYHPISETSYFTAYAVNGNRSHFSEEDQVDLAKVYRDLAAHGCLVMLSNSDAEFIRKLYVPKSSRTHSAHGIRIRKVFARRNINSRAERRGRIREIVVLNYHPPENPSYLTQLFEDDRVGREGLI